FFFSSRRRHTRCLSDWSSDVCSSDLTLQLLNERHRNSIERTRSLRCCRRYGATGARIHRRINARACADVLYFGDCVAHSGHAARSEEHTSELQSLRHLVCRLLLEKKK